MTFTNDPVNHPQHYNSHPTKIEAIQITRYLQFNIGNAVKYIWRFTTKQVTRKDMIEDIDKAIWYLKDHQTNIGFIQSFHDECLHNIHTVYRYYNDLTIKPSNYNFSSNYSEYEYNMLVGYRKFFLGLSERNMLIMVEGCSHLKSTIIKLESQFQGVNDG